MDNSTLIIVIPCFNEHEMLPITHERLTALLHEMIGSGIVSERSRILYVDDGSHDGTWDLIEAFTRSGQLECGIKLGRNSGHQNALMAGMDVARKMGDAVITIDADLQDDISVIPQMVRYFAHEGCEVVYGVRRDRHTDTLFKRKTAEWFYGLQHRLGVRTVYNHADFRLLSRRAVDELFLYHERNLFLRGIVPMLGFKSACVHYDRAERVAGETKYPLGKMVNFAVDGITSFSIRPVRMVFKLGLLFMAVALVMLVYVLCRYFAGDTAVGWPSLILSVWFVGGCILLGLGIVGEYIGKIYIEVKGRPRYNVEQRIIK